jgi:hypothetical protein
MLLIELTKRIAQLDEEHPMTNLGECLRAVSRFRCPLRRLCKLQAHTMSAVNHPYKEE